MMERNRLIGLTRQCGERLICKIIQRVRERQKERERERQVKRSSGNGHLEKYGKTETEGERKWREKKINYQ